MEKKYHLIYDNNSNSVRIKNQIQKKINTVSLRKSTIIIVVGGDGFMLHTLKKLHKYKKSFYGLNSGNYGFLMNKFNINKFKKNLSSSKPVRIHPLEMKVVTKNNLTKKSIAINEVSVLRQSKQAASVKILNGKNTLIKKLVSDGVLVSTPAGSTAYNLSVHGPILNLNSKKIAITPISPFRPRRWKGKVVSDKSKIVIKNLNPKKRPISAVADNFEIRNVKSVKIYSQKKITFKLLYNSNRSLEKKIKLEQIKKETK